VRRLAAGPSLVGKAFPKTASEHLCGLPVYGVNFKVTTQRCESLFHDSFAGSRIRYPKIKLGH
jgi:hypothetical protein